MFRILLQFSLLIVTVIFMSGFANIQQVHDDVKCEPGEVVPGKTTKRQILELCGLAPSSRIAGSYEILEYRDRSAKVGMAIGLGVVGGLAGGLPLEQLAGNYKRRAIVFVDLATSTVRDFYYHDYDKNKGHEPSETLVLQAGETIEDGKVNDAIEMLKKAINLNPKNHRALNLLAWILADLNIDPKAALDYAKKAVDIFPDSPYNNGTLGLAYLRNKDKENASRYLQQSIKLFELYFPMSKRGMAHDKALLEFINKDSRVP